MALSGGAQTVTVENVGASLGFAIASNAATGEPSSFSGAYRVEPDPALDFGAGVRPWRQLGVGGAVSYHKQDAAADVSARLPHPFFLRSHRTVTASLPLAHEERTIHLHAVGPGPPCVDRDRFGGRTLFALSQDLLTDVRFAHDYPYDAATFAAPVTQVQSRSKVGFNVGADVAYYFTETVGVGWLTRFSRAAVDVPSAGERPVGIPVSVWQVRLAALQGESGEDR